MKKNDYCTSRKFGGKLKLLIIMKLALLIIAVTLIQVNAAVYSQNGKFNLTAEDTQIKDVLKELEDNSTYRFFYTDNLVFLNNKVNFKMRNSSVEEVLDKLLLKSPLTYKIFDNHLVVILPITESEQQHAVKGKVTDAEGNPLPGVNIVEVGTTNGAVTDLEGKYTIAVGSEDAVLRFSFVGYLTKEIEVGGQTSIDVMLVEDIQALDEVVVVGYGTMRKSDLTGAVVSVQGEDLVTNTVNTIDQALQGRAAGVQIVNNSGQPGAPTSIRIRGINSLQSSNEPLFVIDGIQVLGDNIPTIGFNFAGGAAANSVYTTNPLSFLNPSDIESIEVLKDAAASAIYGNQGANGVILITTKKGKANVSKVSYNFSKGFKNVTKKINVLNINEYAKFTNELLELKGLPVRPEFNDYESLSGGTDWQDAIFQTGQMTNHNLSFSGGNEKTTFYFGAGYQRDDGILVNTWFDRYSLRLNLDNEIRPWLNFGTNLGLSRTNSKLGMVDSNDGPVMTALIKAPDIPVRDSEGNFAGPDDNQMPPGNLATANPVALTEDRDTRQTRTELVSNGYVNLKWKGFNLKNEIGVTLKNRDDYGFSAKVQYGNYQTGTNSLRQTVHSSNGFEFKNILTYDKKFGDVHTLNAMVAHESRGGQFSYLGGSRSNFLRNEVNQLSNGDEETMGNQGGTGTWRSESYFGRAFYNFQDLAMITAIYRIDGSSKFPKDRRWGTFPSVSAALRISNFQFFKNTISSINNLKILASYGETGNSNIEDHLYLANVTFGNTSLGQGAYFSLPNPFITWEKTKSSNAGLELGLYENRINLQLEAYYKKTEDALNFINLPDFLGANLGTVRANAGSIENKGIEATLSTVNISKSNFKWQSDVTFTLNRNKVISLGLGGVPIIGSGGQFGDPTSYTIEGGPIGRFFGYEVEGLYQNMYDIVNSARWGEDFNLINPGTGLWLGDVKFNNIDESSTSTWTLTGFTGEVVNGEVIEGTLQYTGNPDDLLVIEDAQVIDDNDRTFIGDPNPKFVFGINNSISYKNFDISVFINGSYGNDILNYNRILLEQMHVENINYSDRIKNRAVPVLNNGGNPDNPLNYTLENPNSSIPRIRIDDNPGNNRLSNRYVEDGSYLRIQNVTIGYNLPISLISKVAMRNVRVYLSGQNLVTFTNYSGYDPEIGNLGQSSILQGVDNGHYPLSKNILFGVQVDF